MIPWTVDVVAPSPRDPRLKRWMIHDSRALSFAAPASTKFPKRDVFHKRNCPIWNQGDLGDCTANAALGCMMSDPLWNHSWAFNENDCVRLYTLETAIDDKQIPGRYPPHDTGSTGWYSFKALQREKVVKNYLHAFGLKSALAALVDRPISIGIPYFDSQMDTDKDGYIRISKNAEMMGGHQLAVNGLVVKEQFIWIAQSWGEDWGAKGWCKMTWDDFDASLHMGGDVTYGVV